MLPTVYLYCPYVSVVAYSKAIREGLKNWGVNIVTIGTIGATLGESSVNVNEMRSFLSYLE